MCQSKAEGGARCTGTPFGRAVYALYRDRKAATSEQQSNTLTERIDALRRAKDLYGTCVSPYHMELPEGLEPVLDSARKAGNPLIVGGAVRDSLMGAENKDIDIEVHGVSIDNLARTMRSEGFTVDEVGKQFGVLKISKRGGIRDIDMSVPRRENNVGAGHRGFEVQMDEQMTVEEAGARRDFTFNAISYDAAAGVLVDPYGGVDDFQNKTLRHVSPAFAEDPLRVLRAFQFAGRFNLDIHPDTANLCASLRGQYDSLSTERVTDEWGKFYSKSALPSKGVEVLRASGWDDTIPGLRESLNKERTLQALDRLPSQPAEERIVLGAATVSSNMEPEHQRGFIKTTVLGSKPQRLAMALSQMDPESITDSYQAKVTARTLSSRGFTFALYERYAQMNDNQKALSACAIARNAGVIDGPEEPLVMGRDIIAMTSKKPGPWVSQMLEQAHDKQLRGEFTDRQSALDFVQQHLSD